MNIYTILFASNILLYPDDGGNSFYEHIQFYHTAWHHIPENINLFPSQLF